MWTVSNTGMSIVQFTSENKYGVKIRRTWIV